MLEKFIHVSYINCCLEAVSVQVIFPADNEHVLQSTECMLDYFWCSSVIKNIPMNLYYYSLFNSIHSDSEAVL